ncbi:MAG: hydroxymethylbilane synthase [Otoolea sp.]|nr:hydroxymethylbilane synthase [Clostridium sp.]
MLYRIGTRGSKLALAQAEYVQKKLKENYPEHEFELVTVKTTGDTFSNVPMRAVGAKGIFIKELEEKLLDGSIDLAVHSMKDMPAELPEGLMLAKAWKREDPRDVLILREASSLAELPAGARIATGSLRRKYQLLRLRPDLEVPDIRGNVETRIRKMEEQRLDGIVLAAAGLKRLHLEHRITQYFTYDEMIPAPAQGALAIEMRTDREEVRTLLRPLEAEADDRAAAAERHFLSLMGGGCHLPVGAIGQAVADEISLKVMYGDETGETLVFSDVSGRDPLAVAKEAAECVKRKMKK